MELMDSRCSACAKKDWQCSECQKQDKLHRSESRKAKRGLSTSFDAAAAAAAAAAGPDPAAPPAAPAGPAPASSAAPALANGATTKPKKLRAVLKSSPLNWKMAKIPRDGHCLFSSFVMAFKENPALTSLPQTVKELRLACSKQLWQWNGIIPNLYAAEGNSTLFDDYGNTRVQNHRGDALVTVNLQQYCSALEDYLYGGFEEIMLIVQMYKLQVHVYSQQFYRGGNPIPVVVSLNPTLPPDAAENAGNNRHNNEMLLLSFAFLILSCRSTNLLAY